MLVDRFGRAVKNLRISITQRCNLNCFFCHSEGYSPLACTKGRGEEIKLEDLLLVVKVAAKHGIESVKLTGGEPLLRRDVVDIVRGIKSIPGIKEVSMVSNGVLLAPLAEKLAEAGLDRINVSVHSLDPDTYARITRTGRIFLMHALEGLRRARDAGIGVKINMTVLKGYNEDEIWDMVRFAEQEGVNLQLIEYHTPYFIHPLFKELFFSLADVEKELEKMAVKSYEREMHRRRRFLLKSGIYVETVRPMFNKEFCMHCTRLRVANYEFKPCLMRSDNHVSFESAFSSDDPEKEIEKALLEAVARREPFFR